MEYKEYWSDYLRKIMTGHNVFPPRKQSKDFGFSNFVIFENFVKFGNDDNNCKIGIKFQCKWCAFNT